MREARNFERRLQRALGRSEPWAIVMEWHKDGVWHLHVVTRLAMPMDWWSLVWGLGMVHPGYREGAGDPVKAAGYVAKYVGKALETGTGVHSYTVARGYQPTEVMGGAESIGEAVEAMDAVFGWESIEVVALHEVVEGWPGPRSWWLSRVLEDPD